MRRTILIFCMIQVLFASGMELHQKAVVIVPIADATAQSIATLDDNISVKEMYDQFGYSPEDGNFACPRTHQLLFNEVVHILEEKGEEVNCALCNAFYTRDKSRRNNFWTLKTNLLPLDELDVQALPRPYAKHFKLLPSTDILVLIKPWFNTRDRQWYSVGTRFRRCPTSDRKNVYVVKMINGTHGSEVGLIPKELALVNFPQDFDGRLKLFVTILKNLAADKEYIPYVWGGCSCIKLYKTDDFSCVKKNVGRNSVTHWVRNDADKPCSGFGCSSLILRVAQMAQLPYFFKNTTTLKEHLHKLQEADVAEEGDLIWIPGHVMIVSDLMHNKLIEAVGYSAGYGKVHEISLDKIFKNIATYPELVDAYFKKMPVSWLDKKGDLKKVYPDFLLLKMKSISTPVTEQQ